MAAARNRWTIAGLREALPQGRLLDEPEWRRRHRWIVAVLALHVPALGLWAVLAGHGAVDAGVDAAIVAAFAVLAAVLPGRRLGSTTAALGLVGCSALALDISGGDLSGHFHFFLVISILALYQDWLPFLLSITFVVVHHTLIGTLSHGATGEMGHAPVRTALVHAAFVLAVSAANVVSWRASERLLRDPLTGLAGRLLFEDRLGVALARLSRRPRTAVAVLFIDLDRFKVVNDTHGHAAGDAMLVHVADALRATLRPGDTVARFGGDEFAAICPDVEDEQHAVAIAERLQRAIARPIVVGGLPESTTASVGIALALDPGDTQALIRQADAAMYRAKGRGGADVELGLPVPVRALPRRRAVA